MTSTAQVQANRANAQKSTGPRTAEGKAVAAQNAVRHGLLAKEVVVKGEDAGEFEFYRRQMLAELAPAGSMEEMLAQRIVHLSWRLRRAECLQALAFDQIEDKSERPEPTMSPEDASWMLERLVERGITFAGHPAPPRGRKVVQDFNQERVLDRLLVYERRIEHSLYRTMAELRKLRKEGGITSSMGAGSQTQDSAFGVPVPPMTENVHGQACPEVAEGTGQDVHGQACPELAEWDARATHGRDAHATEPEGGTPNESRETNPISAAVSSCQYEVASEQGQASSAAASNLTLPTSDSPSPTAEVGIKVPVAPAPARQTNPIGAPGSTGGNPVSKRRKTPRMTNADGEWAYDSYLGRWVPLCAALTEEDLNRTDARRSG